LGQPVICIKKIKDDYLNCKKSKLKLAALSVPKFLGFME
jgi:hypothetical protein